jgi:hypothetical protein
VNQSVDINYTVPNSDSNFQNFGITGISAEVWIDASLDSGYPGVQIYCQSGTGTNTWTISGWEGLTPGAWTKVTWDSSTNPAFSLNGPTQVQQVWFGIQTGSNSSGSFGKGNVKLDSIEFY